MQILTIDFETFYSKDFSLSKMTTEEYIRSPEFEIVGVSVARNDEPAEWFSGTLKATTSWLEQFDWSRSVALAHNAMFDMSILNWRCGIRPKKIADTLSMARALHTGDNIGLSLGKLAEFYGLGEKGDEVVRALGMRRKDFSPSQLADYGRYCCNDGELTYKLFKAMIKGERGPAFPMSELELIDMTIRMYSEPRIKLNTDVLEAHLEKVLLKKEELLSIVDADPKAIRSNEQFADLLRRLKIDPPTKISPTTKKETYAFAKSDEEFTDLLEHPDERVQALVAARLGVKSTIEETRTKRFIDISRRGNLPVPLLYYGAHTGRWSGADKVNLQNLPRGSTLKKAMEAPHGYYVCNSDSSQIEARTSAWLAGCDAMLELFQKNDAEVAAGVPKEATEFDPYKVMASQVYGKPVLDIDIKSERHVGKVGVLACFEADTLVLTDAGYKRIVEVTTTDKVWDGVAWVQHQGVINQGVKEVWEHHGVGATPDHEILTEHGWQEWSALTESSQFQSALNVASSPLSGGSMAVEPPAASPEDTTPVSGVIVGGKGCLTAITSSTRSPATAVSVSARSRTLRRKSITDTLTSFLTTLIGGGYSTAFLACTSGATTPSASHTPTTVAEESRWGGRVAPLGDGRFLRTLSRLRGGMSRILNLTASTLTGTTKQETCVSSHAQRTQATSGQSPTCKRKSTVYDLLSAGPRQRFTILTSEGPIIVHNCMYGIGWKKLMAYARAQGIYMDEALARRVVDTYRSEFREIPALWRTGGDILKEMVGGGSGVVEFGDPDGVLFADLDQCQIMLPNGLSLRYPKLRYDEEDQSFKYTMRRGRSFMTKYLWGGSLKENYTQALARIIIGEQMIRVSKRYPILLTVHDAQLPLIPVDEKDEGLEFVEREMRRRPTWASDLPLNCESHIGDTYG